MATTLRRSAQAATHLRQRLHPRRIAAGLIVGLLLIIQLYPLIWLLLSSFKGPTEFNLRPIYALPEGFYWQNYLDAWTRGRLNIYYLNSILVTFPALLLIIATGLGAAFAIEIMRWRGRNLVLLTFLAGIMVPLQIVLLPLFSAYYQLQLLNNHLALILTYTAFGLPLTIFLFTGYLKPIPREVIEAAIVDGANIYQVFTRIVLPMMANAIVTVGLVQFFFIWNDLILSMTFINDVSMRTIQTGLLNFVGQYGQREWGPTFAAIASSVIPILIIYLALNNLIIRGLTAGSVKG